MEKIKLKVTSLFSGIGMQERGLENVHFLDVDVINTCEADSNAIVSYAAMHNNLTREMIDNYANYPSVETMVQDLIDKNIGYDFKNNKAYDWGRFINKKDKYGLKSVWLACKLNHNLGDICKVDRLDYCDMLIYSSPCQCFSVAGTQEGVNCTCDDCGHKYNPFDYDVNERYVCPKCGSDNISGTRSGTLAEVERLLLDMVRRKEAPKYLLMENVDALVSNKFIDDFNKWVVRLDRLGFNSYWDVINGKYCGVPQNRKRVFCLSIRKDIDKGKFEFPLPYDTGVRLKDIIHYEDVPGKYFIDNPKTRLLLQRLEAERAAVNNVNLDEELGNTNNMAEESEENTNADDFFDAWFNEDC